MPLFVGLLACLVAPAWSGTPRASSEAKNTDGEIQKASYAFDGLLSTGWAEGADGSGENEWLEIKLDTVTDVESISIWPGYWSSTVRKLKEFGRPHTVTVQLTGGAEPVEKSVRVLDPGDEGFYRLDVPIQGSARTIRITIDEAVESPLSDDTYIAEVAINFVSGDKPKAVTDHYRWVASEAGRNALTDNKEAVMELFKEVSEADISAREQLATLSSHAEDGVPSVRARAAKTVPLGFRVSAVPPDIDACKALIKVGDANVIPSIVRASTRSLGKTSAGLAAKAKELRASQVLEGATGFSVPAYGRSGVARGELQSRGEPLDISIDSYGGVFVADVANHRVQRFSFDGIVEEIWGGAPKQIDKRWFGRRVDAYAVGARPGEKPGEFTHPVGLAVIPGKEFDRTAVLDSSGRISMLVGDGAVEKVFQIENPKQLTPGQGGEGALVFTKGRLFAALDDEVVVLSAEDGSEEARFTLKDGPSPSAIGLKNGKYAAVYGDQLVMYSTDGFRHGDIIDGNLPSGFENMTVTLDEEGKLWLVTDTGWVIKYKKPGVESFRFQFTERSITAPQVAVYDGMLFVTTTEDAIQRFDIDTMRAENTTD